MANKRHEKCEQEKWKRLIERTKNGVDFFENAVNLWFDMKQFCISFISPVSWSYMGMRSGCDAVLLWMNEIETEYAIACSFVHK